MSNVSRVIGSHASKGTARKVDCPPITIGMPVYNGIEFIDQALAALVEQSYPNFTLLISDNASTDGTWELLQAWAARDDRIVLHRQETNIGATRNFRYVLDLAQTDYFMWHAHDDWLAPNCVEEMVRVITSEPGCTLACGSIKKFRADGSLRSHVPAPRMNDGESRFDRMVTILRRVEAAWIYGLFRTEDLRQAQALREEFGYVWKSERLALLPFILNDRIRGTDRAVFNRRKLKQTQMYYPKTLIKQLRYVGRYLRFHFRILRASRLSLGEKLRCWPALFRHAIKTRGVLDYKHLVKLPFRRVVKSIGSGLTPAIHN